MGLSFLIRDQEVAGSNPVTPTRLLGAAADCCTKEARSTLPQRGAVSLKARPASHNSSYRRPVPLPRLPALGIIQTRTPRPSRPHAVSQAPVRSRLRTVTSMAG